MLIASITPVLPCEAIEPVVAFWSRLGFSVAVSVPHGEVLGFAILDDGQTQLMYQTRASLREDAAALADAAEGSRTLLFIKVDDLDAVHRAVGDAPGVFPKRQTFYGSTEFAVTDPAGHVVTFAQLPEQADAGTV